MVKISSSARLDFRESLAKAEISIPIRDDELSDVINKVRENINSTTTSSLSEETELMLQALRPVYDVILGHADVAHLDSDQLGLLFWDLYCASVSGTQAARRCANLTADSEAWADMITLVLA